MRNKGWESELYKYLDNASRQEFKVGVCDCLTFISDWTIILCSKDPMSKKKESDPDTIRGTYSDPLTAKQMIKTYRKSLPDILDVHFPRQPLTKAKRGDPILAKTPDGNAFGIYGGANTAYFKSQGKGLIPIKLQDCLTAWEIK